MREIGVLHANDWGWRADGWMSPGAKILGEAQATWGYTKSALMLVISISAKALLLLHFIDENSLPFYF